MSDRLEGHKTNEGGNTMDSLTMKAPKDNSTVLLKRTFDQKTYDKNFQTVGVIKFWRVMSKGHKNYGSDLSVAGLREWGIIS